MNSRVLTVAVMGFAGMCFGGGLVNAELGFGSSADFMRCGRTIALSTSLKQESGDWIVINAEEFSRFTPANDKGRLSRPEGVLSPSVVTHASDLQYSFWLTNAGKYDVWIHAKFPVKGFFNHSESMDCGTPRVIHDSEDPITPGTWLPPGMWHWVKTTTYDLVRGPHHWRWLPPGAWCAGCELDRIVLIRHGSEVAPETAGRANLTVKRPSEASLTAKRIKLARVTAWRFVPVFDKGDGDVVFEYSTDGATWRPAPFDHLVKVGRGEEYLRLRVTLKSAPEGKPQPIIYDYAFSVERTGASASTVSTATSTVPGVRPLRIIPNKITYPLGETGFFTVVVTNTAAKDEVGKVEVEERWGVEGDGHTIWRGDVTLKPGEGKTFKVDYPGSRIRYGHEIRVTTFQTSQTFSRSEYFNVNDDWWRVNQGGRLATADGSLTPSIKRLLDYYGYTTNDWKHPKGMFQFYQWEAKMPGMGPFMSYDNIETRWQMERSSCGGNLVTLDYPDAKRWPNIQGQVRLTGDIRKDTEVCHARGFRHTRYTIGFMEGGYGFELARKNPEFIRRGARGQYEGLYMYDGRINPIRTANVDGFDQNPWHYIEPNFFREDVISWALDDLVKCVSALGEDGVYFDGRYMQHQGYDAFGTNLGKNPAADEAIVRNMKTALEKIFAANPNAYVWSNGCTAENPELTLADHPQTGLLKETQWPFLLNPARPDHSYRGFKNGLVQFRDSVWKGGKYVKAPSKNLHCGYLMTSWDPKRALVCGESWVMASHVMSIIASICAHPHAYPAPVRPFKQMMTRYSEVFWHEDNEIVDDGCEVFAVDSLREIWYGDAVYVRKTPAFTQYTIHLMNAPEGEFCDETVVSDPPEADDVEVTTKVFGVADDVKAWAIAPYGCAAAALEPICTKLNVSRANETLSVSVPPFKYYTLLVLRKYR